MNDFTPAPWPDSISDYFAAGTDITGVPAFLHERIAEYTETLASIAPDFKYTDIRVKFGGAILVYLKDEENYDERVHEVLEYMMKELNEIYVIAARS
jgi:hypothetical protein